MCDDVWRYIGDRGMVEEKGAIRYTKFHIYSYKHAIMFYLIWRRNKRNVAKPPNSREKEDDDKNTDERDIYSRMIKGPKCGSN